MRRTAWLISILGMLAAGAAAQEPAASWGEARMGLQLSFTLDASPKPRVEGRFYGTLRLRNSGQTDVKLPAADDVFGWLIVSQSRQTGDRKVDTKLYFSQRISPGSYIKKWPAALKPGQEIKLSSVPVSSFTMYAYLRGMRFREDYRNKTPLKTPPAGTLAKVLNPGKAVLRCCLFLSPNGRDTQLKSNIVEAEMGSPLFARMTAAEQKTFAGKLLKQFDHDAWSGQAAHRVAVEIGKPILPYLIPAAQEPKRPRHSRAWLVTALCDIRDKQAEKTLVKLVGDPAVDVFIAYHGPKLKSEALEKAILARARQTKSSGMIGYALLGVMAHQGRVSEPLMTLGLENDEPRVRAAAAEAMSKMAGSVNLHALVKLLKDKEPRVASTAARVLGCMNNRAPEIVLALIECLKRDNDLLRRRACDSLSVLTDRKMSYDPAASPEEKQRVIKRWEAYGEKLKSQTAKTTKATKAPPKK